MSASCFSLVTGAAFLLVEMIELDLPGNLTTGISRIYVQGAQKGMVLRLYNMDAKPVETLPST